MTGNSSGSVSVTGTISAINASLDGLTYAPTHDYNGTDQLTIVADDLGHTGSPGHLTATTQVGDQGQRRQRRAGEYAAGKLHHQ